MSININNIRIRDPFILADRKTKKYFMYGTTALMDGIKAGNSFSVFTSDNLIDFDGPYVVFDGEKSDFYAQKDYWAAEVWEFENKYFLFGSCYTESKHRFVQIFISDSPLGPFSPLDDAHTPDNWQCLDGTFYQENGIPYMVFCREWCEVEDGWMCAVEMKRDLSGFVGSPFLLFKASDNKYVDSFECGEKKHCRITDGPFLFNENGKIKMIWSSLSNGKYSILEASTNKLNGKWEHFNSRFNFDGGHAMIFKSFEGKMIIALHSPNTPPLERAKFIEYKIK